MPPGDPKPALHARLKALDPTAVQLDGARGEANPAALLDIGLYQPTRKYPDVRRWLDAEAWRSTRNTIAITMMMTTMATSIIMIRGRA